MKKFLLLLSLVALLAPLPAADQGIKNLVISGTFNGTPTGGTLDLSAVTVLGIAPGSADGKTIVGSADPTIANPGNNGDVYQRTNGQIWTKSAGAWTLQLTLSLGTHTHSLSQISQSGATIDQVPKWNGTNWAPADDTGGGGGGGGTWGSITGTLSAQTDLQSALDGKVDENSAITGATRTKITYDAKGLVTAGADATTADIADSSNKRYVTDAQITLLGNTSGTNSGDNSPNTLYSGLVSNATHTGDATGSTALTLATVNSNVGTYGSATQTVTFTVNAKGLITAASQQTVTPAAASTTFSDPDSLFTATNVDAALAEFNDSINAGAPNGTGAKVHWSQLLGVPAGFADGTDDGGGGGGPDADAIHDNVAGEIAAVASKGAPVAADYLLIEDSAASNAKKSATIGSLEAALESVIDLQDLQGAVTDAQVPNTITVDLATVAATANAGDSATAFFTTGTIEDARLPSDIVRGPVSATDNAIARYDSTTGKLLQTSLITIDDNGKLVGVAASSSTASLNLPHGSAPSSPSNGDVWTTTGGFFVRINGTQYGVNQSLTTSDNVGFAAITSTTGLSVTTNSATAVTKAASHTSGAAGIVNYNSNSGTGAWSYSDLAGNGSGLGDKLRSRVNGTAMTTSGLHLQDGASLLTGSDLSGGLTLGTQGAADIIFARNDAEVARFSSAGLELGHATQNTLTASSSILSIESVAIPTISSTHTLTNKTIDGDDNTLQDLAIAAFKGSAIVTAAEGLASSDNDTSVPTTAAVIDAIAAGGGGGGGGTKTYARFTPRDNQPPASNYATYFTRNSVAMLQFDATTEESAVFASIMPEAASLGSGLKVRIHWAATSATSGDCRWGAQIERSNTDLDSDSFDTAVEATTTTSGTSGIVSVTEITITTIDSVTSGDLYRVRIYRDTGDAADTIATDVELYAVEVRSGS